MMVAHYNPVLVAISFLVAVVASYTALDMAGRVMEVKNRATRWWLVSGGTAMGIGVWAMHFIGMLAMVMPVQLAYNLPLTLLSLLMGIAASLFALHLVCHAVLPLHRLISGSITMGSGIIAMHYTGMMAVEISPAIIWDPVWVAASVMVAFIAAGCALYLTFHLRLRRRSVHAYRVAAACVMGVGIAGMHYTGMMAAHFPGHAHGVHGLNSNWMALLVTLVSLTILGIALLTSVLDARLHNKTSELVNSLARANAELEERAHYDWLTGLPNRGWLEQQLAVALAQARSENQRFALMFLDLDDFKQVNDRLGHQAGDLLLVDVVARMKRVLMDRGILARLGGDEFVLFMPVTRAIEAASLAKELVASVLAPYSLAQQSARVSLSVGIALYPEDGRDVRELMFNADTAMYYTKQHGRNNFHFYQHGMGDRQIQENQLISALHQALRNQEFCLYYQPKFCAPTGAIIGFEALIRWQHPEKGLLSPDSFLPCAEKFGLIIAVGNWVLDEACRQLAQWRSEGATHWSVAVNLSALQLAQPELVAQVLTCLEKYQLPPDVLTLEITETSAINNPQESASRLAQLKARGVKISIDDFGTGYANLLYLKALPASELKIDRAFIKDTDPGSQNTAIVALIIELARSLKLNVVAEGVETKAQKDFFTGLGCDVLQGYLLGKPLPAQSVMPLLRER